MSGKLIKNHSAVSVNWLYVKEDNLIIIRNWDAFDSFLNGFSAQKGVLRPSARLPFCVGHHVCLGPTGDANVASPALFWPWYRCLKFWNYFFHIKSVQWQNQEKTKKMGLIFIFNIYFSENEKYLRGIFGESFCGPKWSNNILTLKHVE